MVWKNCLKLSESHVRSLTCSWNRLQCGLVHSSVCPVFRDVPKCYNIHYVFTLTLTLALDLWTENWCTNYSCCVRNFYATFRFYAFLSSELLWGRTDRQTDGQDAYCSELGRLLIKLSEYVENCEHQGNVQVVASCVGNIHSKNYQNVIIFLQIVIDITFYGSVLRKRRPHHVLILSVRLSVCLSRASTWKENEKAYEYQKW